MSDRDREIGRTIAAFRGDRSQQWLAAEMRKRGPRWSQSTVWSVEKGDRALRLSEADLLVKILGIAVSDLLADPRHAELQSAELAIEDAWNEILDATVKFERARTQGRRALAAAAERGLDVTEIESGEVESWLGPSPSAEEAVHHGRAFHAEEASLGDRAVRRALGDSEGDD